jgi:uncharacterized membrane protein
MNNLINLFLYNTPIFYFIQSIWRDEAFSYFMAKNSISDIIIKTASDFNPPLYYILLHFWITIFGRTDILLKLLSFSAHLLTVYYAYLLSKKIFSRKFSVFVCLFTLFNPMLIYYAFEIRMYALYALFTLCSLYYFIIKKWNHYLLVNVFGLYTHSFFIFVPVSFFVWNLIYSKKYKELYLIFKPVLFFLPWIPVIINQFIRSKNSLIFPVDKQLIQSSLGNLFTNYEGTPGTLWTKTAIVSLIILFFIIYGFYKNRKMSLLLNIPIFLPLSFILTYSVIKRPIYVNRYLIFITVFEIIALSYSIYLVKNKIIRNTIAAITFVFIIFFNIYITPFHKKTDFKTLFLEINKIAQENDFVYAKTPIAFLESAYYFKNENKVFIYNPDNISIPEYIGITVTFNNISKTEFPNANKTYLITDDANYSVFIRNQ